MRLLQSKLVEEARSTKLQEDDVLLKVQEHMQVCVMQTMPFWCLVILLAWCTLRIHYGRIFLASFEELIHFLYLHRFLLSEKVTWISAIYVVLCHLHLYIQLLLGCQMQYLGLVWSSTINGRSFVLLILLPWVLAVFVHVNNDILSLGSNVRESQFHVLKRLHRLLQPMSSYCHYSLTRLRYSLGLQLKRFSFQNVTVAFLLLSHPIRV